MYSCYYLNKTILNKDDFIQTNLIMNGLLFLGIPYSNAVKTGTLIHMDILHLQVQLVRHHQDTTALDNRFFLHMKMGERVEKITFLLLFFFSNSSEKMTEWEAIKRAKLDNTTGQSMTTANAGFIPLPFSRYLSNSFQHSQKHPILSDSKLVVYDLKGMHRQSYAMPPMIHNRIAQLIDQICPQSLKKQLGID